MRRRAIAALVLLAASGAGARSSDVWGPPPDWTRYKALGDAAVRAGLPDPSRFVTEWPYGPMKGGWRHKGRVTGYVTCGRLRTTVPVPGFHAVTQFAVVIDDDRVRRIDISTRESNSLVNVVCGQLIARGMIPPASVMAAPADLPVTTLGLTIRIMPDGAYVVSVAPASPAGRAHLMPGMVVTRVNGVALAGMGNAMAAVLGSDASSLTLETAAGERLTVTR